MPYALLVIAVFLAAVFLLPRFVTANPSTVANGARRTLAGSVFAMSAFFALRGLLPIAIALFIAAVAIYGAQKGFGRAQKSTGQKSAVRTSILSMWLDHDSGGMDGEVIAGRHAGKTLSSMALPDLLELLGECITAKDQSETLMMTYLDRVHPDWRSHGAGQSGQAGSMSRADALDILGLKQDASEKEVRVAYLKMMKKHHPDNGGSAWFAARINEANQVLSGKK